MTPEGQPGKRRYGAWAGNPKGNAEHPGCCVEEIYQRGSYIATQCHRKRGHGPDQQYCKQHAKRYEAAK